MTITINKLITKEKMNYAISTPNKIIARFNTEKLD